MAVENVIDRKHFNEGLIINFSEDFSEVEISLNEKTLKNLKDENIFDEDIKCVVEIIEYAISEAGDHDHIYCYFKPTNDHAFYRLIFKQGQHNLEATEDVLALQNKKIMVSLVHNDDRYEKAGVIVIDSWQPPTAN